MTNPSDQPRQSIDDELTGMLKYLRLGRLLAQWDETLEKARQGRYSSERLLKYLLLTPALLMFAFTGAVWKTQRRNEGVLGLDAVRASIRRWRFRDGRHRRE